MDHGPRISTSGSLTVKYDLRHKVYLTLVTSWYEGLQSWDV